MTGMLDTRTQRLVRWHEGGRVDSTQLLLLNHRSPTSMPASSAANHHITAMLPLLTFTYSLQHTGTTSRHSTAALPLHYRCLLVRQLVPLLPGNHHPLYYRLLIVHLILPDTIVRYYCFLMLPPTMHCKPPYYRWLLARPYTFPVLRHQLFHYRCLRWPLVQLQHPPLVATATLGTSARYVLYRQPMLPLVTREIESRCWDSGRANFEEK